jgi:hypothetical protein
MEEVQALMLADKAPEVNRTVTYHPRQNGHRVEAQDLVWAGVPIYSDGSCKDVADKLIARASAALVQPNPDGTLTCLASAVPGNLPQSAVMAEDWALALLVATVKPDQQVALYSHCQAVVNGLQAPEAQVHSYKSKFGGFWQEAQDHVKACFKVPAHLSKDQALKQGVAEEVWAGNYEADMLDSAVLPTVDEVQLGKYLKKRENRRAQLLRGPSASRLGI